MKLILCLDAQNGYAFNRRRQSRDCFQRSHLSSKLQGKTICMSPYSEKLFLPDLVGVTCIVSENYLCEARKEDYVLVEIDDIKDILPQTEEIRIYRWNREYPSDLFFSKENLKNWHLVKTEDIKGSSHDCITYEVYRR